MTKTRDEQFHESEEQLEEAGPTSDDGEAGPVLQPVLDQDVTSAVAVAGHPIHAMLVHFPIALVFGVLGADIAYWYTGDDFWVRVSVWAAGAAFVTGVLAAIAGTAELLLVAGIRVRVASWNHAVIAMLLLAVVGMNWGLRLADPEAILPVGLFLSGLSGLVAGLAGYHGGKLIFDHGIGLMVRPHE